MGAVSLGSAWLDGVWLDSVWLDSVWLDSARSHRVQRDCRARDRAYADGSPSTNRSASAEAGAGYRTTTSVPPLTGVAVTTMSEKR